jgi:hypothetical protein
MQDPSSESGNPSPPPPVLDYARPIPRRVYLQAPGRPATFAIVFGFLVSGTLILVGAGLLILGAMLTWSSVEVARSDSEKMQLGGCYALFVGVAFLILGNAGRRVALRQWQSR